MPSLPCLSGDGRHDAHICTDPLPEEGEDLCTLPSYELLTAPGSSRYPLQFISDAPSTLLEERARPSGRLITHRWTISRNQAVAARRAGAGAPSGGSRG